MKHHIFAQYAWLILYSHLTWIFKCVARKLLFSSRYQLSGQKSKLVFPLLNIPHNGLSAMSVLCKIRRWQLFPQKLTHLKYFKNHTNYCFPTQAIIYHLSVDIPTQQSINHLNESLKTITVGIHALVLYLSLLKWLFTNLIWTPFGQRIVIRKRVHTHGCHAVMPKTSQMTNSVWACLFNTTLKYILFISLIFVDYQSVCLVICVWSDVLTGYLLGRLGQ